jgi:hypothetical protein
MPMTESELVWRPWSAMSPGSSAPPAQPPHAEPSALSTIDGSAVVATSLSRRPTLDERLAPCALDK